LAGNRISNLHRQAFLNVPGLRYLYLSDNRLAQLQPDQVRFPDRYRHSSQLRSFDQLEMIDLTRNQLMNIPRDAFAERRQLRQVYLGENRISQLESGAFRNTSIVILMLPSNQITHLTGTMFDGLTSLQQLSLKDNQVSEQFASVNWLCRSAR
jgi:Leucine-rich repeat (LRR) protein